jgi:DTW domain-containing protein
MSREMCYRCFWPKALCWCASIRPLPTATRFVFLTHPREFKREKAGTGRLAQLGLANSECLVGLEFDTHPRLRELLADPALHPMLLYPGLESIAADSPALRAAIPPGRTLAVLLLDATWSGARRMLRLSPCLQRLPRLALGRPRRSAFVIKQQPQEGCLATIEAAHAVLEELAVSGIDTYADPAQLPGIFRRMQEFQIACALDPSRGGYRRHPYGDPAERTPFRGGSAARRRYLGPPATVPTRSSSV